MQGHVMEELLLAERADPRYAQLLPARILRSIRGEGWSESGRHPPQAPLHPLPGLVVERTHFLGAANPTLTQAMTGMVQPHQIMARAEKPRARRDTKRWASAFKHSKNMMLGLKRRLEGGDE